MKNYSPKKLSFFIAFISTAITIIFWLIDYFIASTWFVGGIWAIIIFIMSYFVTLYILNHFIYDKIKPIYKAIHDINIKNRRAIEDNENTDLISKVKNEVTTYSELKSKEIAKLKEMEKYRKEFLGNVSHELKTPIFNIQGYILTLLEGGINDAEINELYLKRTEKSINRMISIVEDLETITRLEAGELQLNYKDFNLKILVDDVYEMHQLRAKEKGIGLTFGKSTEKGVYVNADRKRIFEAITNLVGNAIKYGREGGSIRTSFYDMDNYILTEIKDDGIGISPEDLPRIFERFYRVDKHRSREEGGTGLGLSIVKHIIDAHNQTINVKSDINKGTSFSFTLAKPKKPKKT